MPEAAWPGRAKSRQFVANHVFSCSRGGFLQRSHVGGEEIHLLREPALDHLVVTVKPEGHGFPEQDLLRDLLVNQTLELIVGRGRPPLRQPAYRQLPNIVLRQNDFLHVGCFFRFRVDEVVSAEQDGSDNEEVEQGLAARDAASRSRSRRLSNWSLGRWETVS